MIDNQIEKKDSKVPVLKLDYKFSQLLGDIREETYCNRYDIDILLDLNNATGYYGRGLPQMKRAGKAKVVIYNWERAAKYGDLWHIGGLGTSDEYLISEFIDIETGRVKPEWEDEFSYCGSKNILYIKYLNLMPEYRHQAWGAYVIKSILDTFDKQYGIAVIYPCPLETVLDVDTFTYLDPYKVGEFQTDFKTGADKLVQYYELLGFKKCEEKYDKVPPYMYLNAYKDNPLFDKIDIYVLWDY